MHLKAREQGGNPGASNKNPTKIRGLGKSLYTKLVRTSQDTVINIHRVQRVWGGAWGVWEGPEGFWGGPRGVFGGLRVTARSETLHHGTTRAELGTGTELPWG